MAQKKAKRKAKRKTGSAKPMRPPKGFEVFDLNEGGFAQSHDFDVEDTLEGELVELHHVPKGGKVKKETRVLDVKTKDGQLKALWESAQLKALFDRVEEIDDITYVHIVFEGWQKVKGRRQEMRQFTVYTK